MLLLQGATTKAAPALVEVKLLTVLEDTKLYQERCKKVSAAVKAGKSRWGNMENQRAAKVATNVKAPAAVTSQVKEVKVAELSTPVAAEAKEGQLAKKPGLTADGSLYNKRVAMVAAAGKAGRSRWGAMEVNKTATDVAKL